MEFLKRLFPFWNRTTRTLIFVIILLIGKFQGGFCPVFAVENPPIVVAHRISQPIRLDGFLDEPDWQLTQPATHFRQREPHEGAPASERTEVRILYDQQNLYIGILCGDSHPDGIVAHSLARDSDLRSDDHIAIIIDTYLDHRTGFYFAINPLGARFDAYVSQPDRRPNESWNGVWDARTRITSEGWQGEIVIPFKTLRFRNRKKQIWGVNFRRMIQRKNEEDLWTSFRRNQGIFCLAMAGELHGLIDVKGGHQLEVFPYGRLGFQKEEGERSTWQAKGGFNLKYGITPALTVDFTVNTDFAQVEADRARINLTRFSLYYPEKRDFFLEGASIFNFGAPHRAQVFYSRRIGLSEGGAQMPILAGGRITGRAGRYLIGLLDVQTASKDTVPETNFFVTRLQRNILHQSKIGWIFAQKFIPQNGYVNRAWGGDINLYFTHFWGDKNLALNGFIAATQSPGKSSDNLAGRFYIDYPNDLFDVFVYYFEVQQNFCPEVGFVRRRGIKQGGGHFKYLPRPDLWGIRQLEFKPIDVDYIADMSGQPETIEFEYRPLGFETQSGEFFEFNIQRNFDRLKEPFEIFKAHVIPAGTYWYTHYEIQFGSNPSRGLSGFLFLNWGDFYMGHRRLIGLRGMAKVRAHLSISLDYTQNVIRLKEGAFSTHEWSTRIGYAFNTRLDTRAFLQWNNEDNEWNLNLRLHWMPNLGSHFYLVYNHLTRTDTPRWKAKDRVLIVKMNYLFRW